MSRLRRFGLGLVAENAWHSLVRFVMHGEGSMPHTVEGFMVHTPRHVSTGG